MRIWNSCTGYSTLWMGLAFRETGGKIITIEYEKLRGLEAIESDPGLETTYIEVSSEGISLSIVKK